jgi:hypothetical protein
VLTLEFITQNRGCKITKGIKREFSACSDKLYGLQEIIQKGIILQWLLQSFSGRYHEVHVKGKI